MDLGRILLKTDALLLLSPKYYGQMRHDNMVVDIASKIGAIRHISLSNTRQNTICFFTKLFHQILVSTDTSRQFTSIERFMLVKTVITLWQKECLTRNPQEGALKGSTNSEVCNVLFLGRLTQLGELQQNITNS